MVPFLPQHPASSALYVSDGERGVIQGLTVLDDVCLTGEQAMEAALQWEHL